MALLKLQEEYLATRDADKIAMIYREMLGLGFTQLTKEMFRYHVTREDVFDLASSVVMRLMEGTEKVINCAPSAYVKRALFYKAKENQRRHLSLDSIENTYYVEDVHEVDVECVEDDVLSTMELPDDLRPFIEDIVRNRMSMDDAKKLLSKGDAWRLAVAMGRVKDHVRASHL